MGNYQVSPQKTSYLGSEDEKPLKGGYSTKKQNMESTKSSNKCCNRSLNWVNTAYQRLRKSLWISRYIFSSIKNRVYEENMWRWKSRLRCITLVSITAFITLLFLILANVEPDLKNQYQPMRPGKHYVEVNMKNCRLELEPTTGRGDQLQILYFFSKYLFNFSGKVLKNPTVTIDPDGDKTTIELISEKKDLRNCYLKLGIPENYTVDQFYFFCRGHCTFVSKIKNIAFRQFNLVGEHFETNIRNLTIQEEVYISADTGRIQINNFFVNRGSINMGHGDIVLQSTNEFTLSWSNSQQAFCFAGPVIKSENTQNCSVAGDVASKVYANNTGCKGITSFCKKDGCSIQPKILQIEQKTGNLYSNLIPEEECDISYSEQLSIFKGSVYEEQGIDFEVNFKREIKSFMDTNYQTRDPIFILNFGKKYAKSATGHKWTVVSNPSFSYVRPWWMTVFSLGLLTLSTHELTGVLAPGFCPFHLYPTLEDQYTVQEKLRDFLNLTLAEITFVQNPSLPDIKSYYQNISSVIEPSKKRIISEPWLRIEPTPEKNLGLIDIDSGERKLIDWTIGLSFFAGLIIGFTITQLLYLGLIFTFKTITKDLNQKLKYEEIVDEKNFDEEGNSGWKADFKEALEETGSFLSIQKHIPRMSNFIGFFSYKLFRHYVNSVDLFTHMLFKKVVIPGNAKANWINVKTEVKSLEMTDFRLKQLYEKFCYYNNLNELNLFDNTKKFEQYGYKFEEEENAPCFTRIVSQKNPNPINRNELDSKNSIEIFFRSYYDISSTDIDFIFVDEIQDKFDEFCHKYKLARRTIVPEKVRETIGYNIINKKKYKLFKMDKPCVNNDIRVYYFKYQCIYYFWDIIARILRKIYFFFQCLISKKYKSNDDRYYYEIDESALNFQFRYYLNIMSNKKDDNKFQRDPDVENQFLQLSVDEKVENRNLAINKLIWHPVWIEEIVFYVFIQILVSGVLILPFILLSILYETSYEPYSLIDREYLISSLDFLESPWEIPSRLDVFMDWNICVIIITIIVSSLNFNDHLIYLARGKKIEDMSFLSSQKELIDHLGLRVLANIHWLLIFFIILCYTSYIGVVLMWLILGAIVNPNNFLIYASASLTVLTFVSNKYQFLKNLSTQGADMIQNILEDLMKEQIKSISAPLLRELNKTIISLSDNPLTKQVVDSVSQKAKIFGLENEVNNLMTIGSNPDKFLEQTMSAASEAIIDPQTIINRLNESRDDLIEKLEQSFRKKCSLNGINEETAELFLGFIMKKSKEKSKSNLTHHLSSATDIPPDLVRSILDLFYAADSFEKTGEARELIFQKLVIQAFCYSVKLILNENFPKQFRLKSEFDRLAQRLFVFIMKQGNKEFVGKYLKDFLNEIESTSSERNPNSNLYRKYIGVEFLEIVFKNNSVEREGSRNETQFSLAKSILTSDILSIAQRFAELEFSERALDLPKKDLSSTQATNANFSVEIEGITVDKNLALASMLMSSTPFEPQLKIFSVTFETTKQLIYSIIKGFVLKDSSYNEIKGKSLRLLLTWIYLIRKEQFDAELYNQIINGERFTKAFSQKLVNYANHIYQKNLRNCENLSDYENLRYCENLSGCENLSDCENLSESAKHIEKLINFKNFHRLSQKQEQLFKGALAILAQKRFRSHIKEYFVDFANNEFIQKLKSALNFEEDEQFKGFLAIMSEDYSQKSSIFSFCYFLCAKRKENEFDVLKNIDKIFHNKSAPQIGANGLKNLIEEISEILNLDSSTLEKLAQAFGPENLNQISSFFTFCQSFDQNISENKVSKIVRYINNQNSFYEFVENVVNKEEISKPEDKDSDTLEKIWKKFMDNKTKVQNTKPSDTELLLGEPFSLIYNNDEFKINKDDIDSLKWYFSYNLEAFTSRFIHKYWSVHGSYSIKEDELAGVLSIFTYNTRIDSASSFLQIQKYFFEYLDLLASIKIQKFSDMPKNSKHKNEPLIGNKKIFLRLCKNLELDPEETEYFIRVLLFGVKSEDSKGIIDRYQITKIMDENVFRKSYEDIFLPPKKVEVEQPILSKSLKNLGLNSPLTFFVKVNEGFFEGIDEMINLQNKNDEEILQTLKNDITNYQIKSKRENLIALLNIISPSSTLKIKSDDPNLKIRNKSIEDNKKFVSYGTFVKGDPNLQTSKTPPLDYSEIITNALKLNHSKFYVLLEMKLFYLKHLRGWKPVRDGQNLDGNIPFTSKIVLLLNLFKNLSEEGKATLASFILMFIGVKKQWTDYFIRKNIKSSCWGIFCKKKQKDPNELENLFYKIHDKFYKIGRKDISCNLIEKMSFSDFNEITVAGSNTSQYNQRKDSFNNRENEFDSVYQKFWELKTKEIFNNPNNKNINSIESLISLIIKNDNDLNKWEDIFLKFDQPIKDNKKPHMVVWNDFNNVNNNNKDSNEHLWKSLVSIYKEGYPVKKSSEGAEAKKATKEEKYPYNEGEINIKVLLSYIILKSRINAGKSLNEMGKLDELFEATIEKIKHKLDDLLRFTNDNSNIFSGFDSMTKLEKRDLYAKLSQNIAKTIFSANNYNCVLIKSLAHFVKNDWERVDPSLFVVLKLDESKHQLILKYLLDLKGMLKDPNDLLDKKMVQLKNKILGTDLSSLRDISRKISEDETLLPKDLFKLIDVDKSGKISNSEFINMTRRLGMNLTPHRISEIFSSVKAELGESLDSNEINEREFSLALSYVQRKSLILTLETLGITRELLMLFLLMLTGGLLVVFTFIIIGVHAFAVAGTFGAIINSIFPMAGGMIVSESDQNYRSVLESKEFKITINKCRNIIQSMRI